MDQLLLELFYKRKSFRTEYRSFFFQKRRLNESNEGIVVQKGTEIKRGDPLFVEEEFN